MLAQLDGLVENDGLIFIATTNDLTAIDPALRERPSRFDVVMKIGLPTLAARRMILEKNLPAGAAVGELLDMAAAATADLSGAHVREVAYLAVQRALLRDACDDQGQVRPQAEDFTMAIEQVGGARKTICEFGASTGETHDGA
ncbi:MAG TPA: AAA family ATPase [Pirellulales bacterium]|nr:AAA family ATPase [Pirellulales bacterium]